MAYFAQLDSNNKVTLLHFINDEMILDENDEKNEELGINFCKKIFGENTNWKLTSHNSNFRKHRAEVGYTYDENFDAFIPPKPYSSWILDEETFTWVCPLGSAPFLTKEQQQESLIYMWDEDLYQSNNNEGWKIVPTKEAASITYNYK